MPKKKKVKKTKKIKIKRVREKFPKLLKKTTISGPDEKPEIKK